MGNEQSSAAEQNDWGTGQQCCHATDGQDTTFSACSPTRLPPPPASSPGSTTSAASTAPKSYPSNVRSVLTFVGPHKCKYITRHSSVCSTAKAARDIHRLLGKGTDITRFVRLKGGPDARRVPGADGGDRRWRVASMVSSFVRIKCIPCPRRLSIIASRNSRLHPL